MGRDKFGDIDRLVHHAEVISLKGDSYRLKDRDRGRIPAPGTRRVNQSAGRGQIQMPVGGQDPDAVDIWRTNGSD